jgi:hypothetical protein
VTQDGTPAADRAALRMQLVEFIGTRLPGEAASDLFELASADPQIFFAELISRHRSGELVLPEHLARAVARDLHHRGQHGR